MPIQSDATEEMELRRRMGFRDPGGRSALRRGARIHPCPTCKTPNVLSEADKKRGYQCDRCADAEEGIY